MLTGSIHAIYLLAMGLPLADIALLQVIYSSTFLLLEMPTAWFAIRYRAKTSVIVGALSWGVYFLLCLSAPNFLLLSVGVIMYALGSCFMSGATQEWMVLAINHQHDGDKNKIYYYQHLLDEYISLLTIAFGGIGAIIAYFSDLYYQFIYIVTALLMFMVCIALTKQVGYKNHYKNIKEISWKKEFYIKVLLPLKRNLDKANYIYYLLLCVLITCVYQPVYHYWQPYLVELNNIEKGIDNSAIAIFTGITFVSYCLCRYLIHKLIRHYRTGLNSFYISLSSLLSAALFIGFISFNMNINIAAIIILFSLFHGALSLGFSEIRAYFINQTKTKDITLTISSVSVIARSFSVVFLAFIGFYIMDNPLQNIFKIVPCLCMLAFLLLVFWYITQRKTTLHFKRE